MNAILNTVSTAQYNTLDNYCMENQFRRNANYNSLGHFCGRNVLNSNCSHNSFSAGCGSNTLQDNCIHNSFSGQSQGNTLKGNTTKCIFISAASVTTLDYTQNCHFVNCDMTVLVNSDTGSATNLLSNYRLYGLDHNHSVISVVRNNKYITKVGLNSDREIVYRNEFDDPEPESIQSITYATLVSMRNSNSLRAGMRYRITDFQTEANDPYFQSAQHPYDIVVEAVTANSLAPEAHAVLHAGDTYFASSNLQAWTFKYCLDNDTNKFEWATSSGKGVVYDLTDEFGNYAPFDFKNIKFFVTKPGDIAPDDGSPAGSLVYMFGATADGSLTGAYRDNHIDDDFDEENGTNQRFIVYANVTGSHNRVMTGGGCDITIVGNNNLIKPHCETIAIYGNNNVIGANCSDINGSLENATIGANCTNINIEGGGEAEIGHHCANLHLLQGCWVVVHPNTAPAIADGDSLPEITSDAGRTKHWALATDGTLKSWYPAD